MARPKQPIKPYLDGRHYKVSFFHPVAKKVVRRTLGATDPDIAANYAGWLTRIRDDPSLWKAVPRDTPSLVRDIWLIGQEQAELSFARPDGSRGRMAVPALPSHFKKVICRDYRPGMDWRDVLDFSSEEKAESVAAYLDAVSQELEGARAQLKVTEEDRGALRDKVALLERELQVWRKKRLKSLEVPTLAEARDRYLASYKAGPQTPAWKAIVEYTVKKFVEAAGPSRKADQVDEKEVDAWVNSLRSRDGERMAGASRRKQARAAILRFFDNIGVGLDRKALLPITRRQLRSEKGEIVWLERDEAGRLIKALYRHPNGRFWGDVAQVQVSHGWRPQELPLLQCRLAESEQMTVEPIRDAGGAIVRRLKNGPRTVRTPTPVRSLVQKRVGRGTLLLFPFTEVRKRKKGRTSGSAAELWNPTYFDIVYLRELRAAAKKAGIKKPIDCRTLRRTCASLLLRAGLTTDAVAEVLGDDPNTVRDHYARLLPREVDTSAAAVKI